MSQKPANIPVKEISRTHPFNLPEPGWARPQPELCFTPYAWAKLLFLRDAGDTEIGGFGIASEHNPLLVEDLAVINQTTTAVTVAFDDAAVADFFDDQAQLGRSPERFSRIWIHTHPGSSAQPSGTDEETFQRAFGRTHWSLMFILARGGETYARLRFNVGPGGEQLIRARVEFEGLFPASDPQAWTGEYRSRVHPCQSAVYQIAAPALPPAPAEAATTAQDAAIEFTCWTCGLVGKPEELIVRGNGAICPECGDDVDTDGGDLSLFDERGNEF